MVDSDGVRPQLSRSIAFDVDAYVCDGSIRSLIWPQEHDDPAREDPD